MIKINIGYNEQMNAIIKKLLLSNRDVKPSDSIYFRLITINISLFFVLTIATTFTIVNVIEESYIMFSVDFFAVLFAIFCGYLLRKNYDIEKIASYLIIMLFFVFVSIIIIRQALEYTLLWSLLFPLISIVLKGTKSGLYYSIIYSVISLIIVYGFIGETITVNAYIRFFALSIILISLVYFNQYTMENVLLMLKESKDKVDELNKDLEQYNEEVIEESNVLKERLELALIGSNAGIWDWNVVSNEVYFSPRFKEMLGYSDDELINDYSLLEELAHPDDFENILRALKESLHGKTEYFESIHRMRHKEGYWVWIHDRGKTFFDEDGKAIRMSGTHTDVTKQRNIEEELIIQKDALSYQAHHDYLTGLPNRILFNDRLAQAIEKAKRKSSKIALLFIDLDHFKEINDSLGHETGDEVLKEVTHRLSGVLREEDTLARLGGDEFIVILENLQQAQDASILAKKILDALVDTIKVGNDILYVSTSIGVSIYPDDGSLSEDLLKYADSAMYKAKEEGRNNFQFYSAEMTELAFERVVMEVSLRAALQNEEFIVHYQPQVNGFKDKITGFEALVRWKHQSIGVISPAKFIPLAESTGLIVELDRYVMKTAMKQIVQWYKDGLNPGVVSINLSVKQLQQKDFLSVLKDILNETQCKTEWIELEVTESQIMTHPDEAIEILRELSKLGISLAVDDFGTGYSSLAYLKRLPINKLKIDQSFIMDIPHDEEDIAITKAVIALSTSLRLQVIAEGVETKEQKEFLVENGCESIQGYYYSKPLPAGELEILLLNGLS